MNQTEKNEYKLLYSTSREFSQKVLLPYREENDRYPFAGLDQTVFEKAYSMDFFHLWLPESMGGLEGDIGKLCTVLLNIAEIDASMAMVLLTNAMAQEIMIQAGEMDRLSEIYSRNGSLKYALIAFPSFLNPLEMTPELMAVEKENGVRLSGLSKGMVMGSMAENMIVFARFPEDPDSSCFLIAASQETVRIGDPVISLGLHACPTVDIDFNETPGILIGERGRASEYYGNMYGRLVLAGAAIAAGIMRGSFTDALKYSQSRIQGGKKIAEWSEVQLLLANMALKVRNAEMLIEYAGAKSGKDAIHDSIAASIPVLDHACDVASDGIQILGGYGYMEDYSQEKRYRDAQHLQSLFGISCLKKIQYVKSCYKLA